MRRGLCLIFWVSAAGAGYSLAAWFATEGRNGSGPLGHFWLAAAVALAGLAAPGRAASPPARG